MKTQYFSTRRITYFAILLALVIVLQIWASMIPIGAVQLNFSLVPIVLGAILLGPVAGAILGFACGVVILIQVIMGIISFYTIIWTGAPVVVVFICLLKTTVAGLVAGLLYKLICKKNRLVAIFVASAMVPIINTTLFILGCLAMWDVMASMAGGSNIFGFIIVSVVGYNFFVEFGISFLLSPALGRVVSAIEATIKPSKAVIKNEEDDKGDELAENIIDDKEKGKE